MNGSMDERVDGCRYDMREKCEVPPLCYDFSQVGTYLKRPEVVSYVSYNHIKRTHCCAPPVAYIDEWMLSLIHI